MKLTAPSKKVKTALSKVSTSKVTKKREKEGLAGKSKEALAAMLGFATEALTTPEKKIVGKTLKKKKSLEASPVASASLKKSTKASKKNVAESPVVSKGLKTKKKAVEKSPVITKSLKKNDVAVESPVASKALKTKKKKTVANSPVVAKSSKKMTAVETKAIKEEAVEEPVKAIKEEAVEEPPVVSVSLQKPTKASKKSTKTATPIEPLSKTKGAKSMKKVPTGKKSKAAVTAVKLEKKPSLNVIPEVPLDEKLLEGVCAATLKLVNSFQEGQEKKDLFGSLGQPINLQLNLFKVPQTPQRIVRCQVPNSIYSTEPDVLLVLPDIKRGRFRDVTFAQYLQQYEEKLSEAGIKGIKQIIPYTQLRAEYSQYELKRRLVKSFDIILCDGRIDGPCNHFLGSVLTKANKTLTPIRAVMADIVPNEKGGIREIKFNPDLQRHVDAASLKVALKLQGKGATCSITIGHSQFTEKQLADNIKTVWSFLAKELPGGVKNIQSALLKGNKTLAVPVYASLIPPKEVPVVLPKVKDEVVEDELSTVPGFTAVVDRFGNVQLKNNQTTEDLKFVNNVLLKKAPLKRSKKSQGGSDSKRIKEEPESDESESEMEQFNDDEFNGVPAIPKEEADDLGESDSDLDDGIANAAEEAYLNDWAESADLEDQEKKKKSVSTKKRKSNKKGSNKTSSIVKDKTAPKMMKVENGKQPAKKKASKKSPAFIGIQT